MATKKAATQGKKTSGDRWQKIKKSFLVCLIIVATVLVGGAIYGLICLPEVLMTENRHFALKKVVVESNGYWNNRGDEACREFEIEKDSNLFDIDLEKIKKDVKSKKGIEHCEIEIVLPDTLKIKIRESVPRAVLELRHPDPEYIYVVDEAGKFFSRNRDGVPVASIPRIRHFSGGYDDRLLPAMQLTMTAMKDYPDIRIKTISIKRKDQLDARISYREQIDCIAIFPAKDIKDEYKHLLNTLQSVILQAYAERKTFSICDLRFDGKPVTK